MSLYGLNGKEVESVYRISGEKATELFDIYGNKLSNVDPSRVYIGGYIEIQPDSWDGFTPVSGESVDVEDDSAWGFPMSLSEESFESIQSDVLAGNGYGIMYIRFPLGFAYRGYRNIDADTGLAKNIGERWDGQNDSLRTWLLKIAEAGGGLAPEYWCLAPYWVTGGAYYNPDLPNEVWAGGDYERTVSLESIRNTDALQYNSQIELISNAIIDDLEYIHTNICPVRLFGLANEPWQNGQKYGTCKMSKNIYVDLMKNLALKINESNVLSKYNGADNKILLYDNDEYCENAAYLWGHAIPHTNTRTISGENGGIGADWYKTAKLKNNSFLNEYEYWNINTNLSDEFRCANDMLHMINSIIYGRSQVVHPIIHICKPTGQTSSDTNTKGYCMFAVNMEDGSYTPNTWVYNSWKMLNDNLPIGSVYVSGGDGGNDGTGYIIMAHENNLYLLTANNTENEKEIIVGFDKDVHMSGLLYNISNLGTNIDNIDGKEITIHIPPYSGLVYKTVSSI